MANRVRSELIRETPPPERAGDLVSAVVDARAGAEMAARRRAWMAWRAANGDRERAHTVYVSLKRPRRKGADPIILVGVDSHSFLSDVTANREIYLARLANVGFAASALEVRIARRERQGAGSGGQAGAAPQGKVPARPLTAAEREKMQGLLARLPEAQRASASKALEKAILLGRLS